MHPKRRRGLGMGIRHLSAITLVVAMAGCQGVTKQPGQTVRQYSHDYRDLVPGESDRATVKKVLGDPIKIKKMSNGENYEYANLTINFSTPDPEVINTILFHSQSDFVCPNGFRIGDEVSVLLKTDLELEPSKVAVTDMGKGILYWHADGKVTKIVLARSLVDRRPAKFGE